MKKLLFLMSILTVICPLKSQDEIEFLYNAAVEKYIRNDYDKAIEYMEKVYSMSKQQKHKNFLIKILKEAATSTYMKQNYKKAFEYTSKALNYTKDDPEINKLHNILLDLLDKQEKQPQPKEAKLQEKYQQKETRPEKQITPTKLIPKEKTQPIKQPQNIPTKEEIKEAPYKVLFFTSTSTIVLISLIWGLTQIKTNHKIKQKLQEKILELEKENSKLKLELIDAKKEIEKVKETEEIYKKYLEEYKKDTEEKLKLIKELQLSQSIKPTHPNHQTSKPKTDILSQTQQEIIALATNLPEGIIYSEYQLEVYREKLATMLKTLYQLNPEKALSVLNQMLNHPLNLVKANIAYALAEIANELTIEMLFELYQDQQIQVKQEALRQLIRLEKKIKNNEVEISEETKNKIIATIKEEKSKGEWLF